MERTMRPALAIILILATATPAAAQVEPTADQLWAEGAMLFDQGRYAEACPKIKRSYELQPALKTRLGRLATCYKRLGQLTLARDTYLQVLVETKDRPGLADVRAVAAQEWQGLDAIVPRLTITVAAASQVPGLAIALDGRPAAAGTALSVDPGAHKVTATAPDHDPFERDVELAARTTTEVVVTLVARPPVIVPMVADTDPSPGRGRRIAGLVTIGGGALTVGAGLLLGLLAKSDYDDANTTYCHGNLMCPTQAGVNAVNAAKDRATVASVVFGVGVAAAATGLILYLTAPDPTPSPPSKPHFGAQVLPGGLGVTVDGSF